MTRSEKRRLLAAVSFTPYRAFRLFLYSWVCACIGLCVFFMLARQSFYQCADAASARLSQSLQVSARLFRGSELPLDERQGPAPRFVPFNLRTSKYVGLPDLAVKDKPELERIHGQRRRAGRDVYEVRFVPGTRSRR